MKKRDPRLATKDGKLQQGHPREGTLAGAEQDASALKKGGRRDRQKVRRAGRSLA